ncbi:histidine phosphatase family protein [uncultured Phenylobacterium sp.]|uniref:histidine phosphatase family protein n=1 Tax=uncultured Phenylobacterium sp. TaxID=349273 RepID=UPI0025D09D27|nr:histidine phosphatase family protein [uncultured Phenylobacterium sp.]
MILLARHGETEWNVERRMQGRKDSPLTGRGQRQAHAMAALVRSLAQRDPGPWRVITSPLGRAHATAGIIAAAAGLSLEADDRLMEVSCGDWEGRLWAEVGAGVPATAASRRWIFNAVGGESYEEVEDRVANFLASVEPEPHRRLVVVSHGVSGRILRGVYAGLTQEAVTELDVPQDAVYRLQNGQIDRFDCEPVE